MTKFYHYLPSDVRDTIDQMKHRVEFWSPKRNEDSPYLRLLLDASIKQQIITVQYDSREGIAMRNIQPIGIFSSNGFWYCVAYCFLRGSFRQFRTDRFQSAAHCTDGTQPIDLTDIHLGNWNHRGDSTSTNVRMRIRLTREGVRRCRSEEWAASKLNIDKDGSGYLDGEVPVSELHLFASYFLGFGIDAVAEEPQQLVDFIKSEVKKLAEVYRC